MAKTIITVAAFDGMDSQKIRFIHEISRWGKLNVLLLKDELIQDITGYKPRFSESERHYFIESIRYINNVWMLDNLSHLKDIAQYVGVPIDAWVTLDLEEFDSYGEFARQQRLFYTTICSTTLSGYPEHEYNLTQTSGKKVVVTGCFDWFHTGHIRFFEEASEYGDLYVVLGHDENIEKLKGPGHPMFPEDERKYMAGSIRFVKQALISSGDWWLDAEPEIKRINPDSYVVNEDGDKDVKREFCEKNGIEYIVLKRKPKPGLKRRTSTNLRGF